MAYLTHMDKTTTQNQVFTIRTVGQPDKNVEAKSIWRAFESAVLTGDILVFESIAAKKEGK